MQTLKKSPLFARKGEAAPTNASASFSNPALAGTPSAPVIRIELPKHTAKHMGNQISRHDTTTASPPATFAQMRERHDRPSGDGQATSRISLTLRLDLARYERFHTYAQQTRRTNQAILLEALEMYLDRQTIAGLEKIAVDKEHKESRFFQRLKGINGII